MSFGTSLLLELVPGDPVAAALGDSITPESYEQARLELGLDKSVPERYADWVGNALTGDFGRSIVQPGVEVRDVIEQSLPITLQLAGMALLMALVVAVPLGVWSAYREGTAFDRGTEAFAAGLISVPPFLAALLLIFFFVFHDGFPRTGFLAAGILVAVVLAVRAVQRLRRQDTGLSIGAFAAALVVLGVTLAVWSAWPSFPRIGFVRLTSEEGLRENLRSAFLPALTLALTEIAVFTRLLRTDMAVILREDYISAAKAKGMPVRRVLFRDALKPSSFSLITLAGVSLGRLIGGTVIIEQVFGIQGMGRVIVGAITTHDFPIVQAGVLVVATAYVLVNTAVDISYAFLDPRIRRGRS